MRTTIEMKPEHRARVPELAARRGDKGFSAVVADALDLYLETLSGRRRAVMSALSLKGSMKRSRSGEPHGADPEN